MDSKGLLQAADKRVSALCQGDKSKVHGYGALISTIMDHTYKLITGSFICWGSGNAMKWWKLSLHSLSPDNNIIR